MKKKRHIQHKSYIVYVSIGSGRLLRAYYEVGIPRVYGSEEGLIVFNRVNEHASTLCMFGPSGR